MSIFSRIKDAIFHTGSGADKSAPMSPRTSTPATPVAPSVQPQAVDIEAMLAGLAAKNPQKLNWKTSIVDLMKLVDLDPSLENRKTLAAELGYTGDTSDSASMNIWLHKQVMTKLAQSGGKVPESLK